MLDRYRKINSCCQTIGRVRLRVGVWNLLATRFPKVDFQKLPRSLGVFFVLNPGPQTLINQGLQGSQKFP